MHESCGAGLETPEMPWAPAGTGNVELGRMAPLSVKPAPSRFGTPPRDIGDLSTVSVVSRGVTRKEAVQGDRHEYFPAPVGLARLPHPRRALSWHWQPPALRCRRAVGCSGRSADRAWG